MCFNCGCGIPNDNMGKGNVSDGGFSLVEDDIKRMAKGWEMTEIEAKKNMLEMLQKQVGSK